MVFYGCSYSRIFSGLKTWQNFTSDYRNSLCSIFRARSPAPYSHSAAISVVLSEPLCQPELPDFMKKSHDAGVSVKLDTNGSFPERLQAAVESHCVDYVAMDIKNAPEKYAATTASAGVLEAVRKSVAYLKQGTVPYEFRTTVVTQFHDAGDFEAIGAWIEGAPRYFLQSFADSGSLLDSRCSGVPKEEMDR